MVEQRSIVLTALILAMVAAGAVFYFLLPRQNQPETSSLTLALPSAVPTGSPAPSPLPTPETIAARPVVAGAATQAGAPAVSATAETGASLTISLAAGAAVILAAASLTALAFGLF